MSNQANHDTPAVTLYHSPLWYGRLSQPNYFEAAVVAYPIAGYDLRGLTSLPDSIIINGVISLDQVDQYLLNLRKDPELYTSVLSLETQSTTDAIKMLIQNHNGPQVCGVVNITKPAGVESMFVIPLREGDQVPSFMASMRYCSIQVPIKQAMFLAVCVVDLDIMASLRTLSAPPLSMFTTNASSKKAQRFGAGILEPNKETLDFPAKKPTATRFGNREALSSKDPTYQAAIAELGDSGGRHADKVNDQTSHVLESSSPTVASTPTIKLQKCTRYSKHELPLVFFLSDGKVVYVSACIFCRTSIASYDHFHRKEVKGKPNKFRAELELAYEGTNLTYQEIIAGPEKDYITATIKDFEMARVEKWIPRAEAMEDGLKAGAGNLIRQWVLEREADGVTAKESLQVLVSPRMMKESQQ